MIKLKWYEWLWVGVCAFLVGAYCNYYFNLALAIIGGLVAAVLMAAIINLNDEKDQRFMSTDLDDQGFMTTTEHDLVTKLGELMDDFNEIMGDAVTNDKTEAVDHVHALQNMVLSQAARRAYPNRYRMLGSYGTWSGK